MSTTSGGLMILFAVFVDFVLDPFLDVISFGLLGFLADLLAAFVFSIWLMQYGVSLYGGTYALGSLGTTVIEGLPVASIFPVWTIWIVRIVFNERRRDVAVY